MKYVTRWNYESRRWEMGYYRGSAFRVVATWVS